MVEGAVDGAGDVLVGVLPDETAPGLGDTPSGLDWGGCDLGGALDVDPVPLGQGRACLAGLEERPQGQ